jgi:hypothetical protein
MIFPVSKVGVAPTNERLKASFWLFNIFTIYFYLYFCIFYGEPFFAFDHINYINFLNDPYWNFFEPGYTFLSFLVNVGIAEELRFSSMFVLATLPPLLLVIVDYFNTRKANSYLGLMIFSWILIKSFYIGFVAQRFFFAELWVASLMILRGSTGIIGWRGLVPGAFQFSSLTIIPSLFFLNFKFSIKKYSFTIVALIVGVIYIKYFSDFKLFGYDYSRYLDSDSNLNGLPILSILEVIILSSIVYISLEKKMAINIVCLLLLVVLTKLALGQFEVISRVFQIQIDLVIILIGLNAKKNYYLTYLFCIGFFLMQVFLSANSRDMWVIHHEAFSNALSIF